MTPADRPRFVTLVSMLAEQHRRDITDALLEGYWLALGDLPIEDVEAGTVACLRTSRFMPSAAEIRGAVRQPAALRAAEAWESVARGVRRGGADLDDPIAANAVRVLGGWDRLGMQDSDRFHEWTRKEFLRLYEMLDESETARGALLPSGEHALIADEDDPDAQAVLDEENAVE